MSITTKLEALAGAPVTVHVEYGSQYVNGRILEVVDGVLVVDSRSDAGGSSSITYNPPGQYVTGTYTKNVNVRVSVLSIAVSAVTSVTEYQPERQLVLSGALPMPTTPTDLYGV